MNSMENQAQVQNAYRFQSDNTGDIGVDLMYRDIETEEQRKQNIYNLMSAEHQLACNHNFYNFNDGVWVNWGVLGMATRIKEQFKLLTNLEYGPELHIKDLWAVNKRRNSLKHEQNVPGSADNDWFPEDGGLNQRVLYATLHWEQCKMPEAGKSAKQIDFNERRHERLNGQLTELAARIEEAEQHYNWMKEAYEEIAHTPYKPWKPKSKASTLGIEDITSASSGADKRAVALMERTLVE
jgi:hypothetical protein